MKNHKRFLLILLVLAAACGSFSCGRPKKPNILLVTVCSLRRDHLGCYGYARAVSPHIDALAKKATLYERCYTPIPWTKPGVISLLTGYHPREGVEIPDGETMPEWLKSRGYETRAFVGTNIVREGAGMDRGFDVFLDNRDMETGQNRNSVDAGPLVAKAMESLSRRGSSGKPLFVWLFFKDPHFRYLPPKSLRDKFINDELYRSDREVLAENKSRHDSLGGVGEAKLKDEAGRFITRKAYYIAQYDAEIVDMDAHLGAFLEYLKQDYRFDDWLIVFSADHGESLGENDYYFDHGYLLSEGLVRIPLIVKMPGQARGRTVDGLVSSRDVFPMIKEVVSPTGEAAFSGGSERFVVLENSPVHERGKKLFGCVQGAYKLVFDPEGQKDDLYLIEGDKEIEVTEDPLLERQKVLQLKKIIEDSLKGREALEPSVEDLRSLGYLQ